MHIFAYGTLLFPEVWRAVTELDSAFVAGSLRGYAAFRVNDAVYPGVVRANDDSVVHGIVYYDVNPVAVARLDRFENDFYRRETVTIDCVDGRQRQADAYIVPIELRHVLTDEPWTRDRFLASGGLEAFVTKFAGFSRME